MKAKSCRSAVRSAAGNCCRANEADMTGDDWTALGNTLWYAEASDKKAHRWIVFGKLHISAAHGAYAIWASAWSRGNGVEADPVPGFGLYQQAVEMGSLNAVCCFGRNAINTALARLRMRKKAAELYCKAAEYGSPRGQMLLARAFHDGSAWKPTLPRPCTGCARGGVSALR